jgi:drug/metabolite transporter (DMT)-like permease
MGELVRGCRHAVFLGGAAASWGVATVISKRAVDEIPPLTLLPVQLTVSVAVLALVIWVGRQPVGWTPQLRRLGALGVLNPGLSYAIGLLGLAHITASMSVLLWAVEPVLILLLARAVLRERISRPIAMATTLAVGGVLLVVAQSDTHGDLPGVLLTLAGVAACAAYTVICRKLLADDTTLTVVIVQQTAALVFAIVVFATVHLAFPADPVPGHVSGWAWLSAITSGALYYAIAFWLYLTGLRHTAASTAGAFLTLIPVFGVAAGHLLLAERLTIRQWVGASVIVGAVATVALLTGHPQQTTRPKRRTGRFGLRKRRAT